MNKLAIALSTALSLGAAASASAADGNITFTGKVVASTCSVDVGGGSGTGTIALRQISANAFKSDETVGSTPFTITLAAGGGGTTCSMDNARLVVDASASDLSTDGMITDQPGGAGARTSARVKLMDADNPAGLTVINLSDLADAGLVREKTAGEFKYNFVARYHNPTASDLTAGDFSGRLAFDIDNF
ncbi:hypothetical protein STENOSP10_25540 [Stenotrophomonas sepilia]|uniref:Fimbrial-type adhesion domain-containing protein n=1 Tax=Stenotrophomonas sepilia TaxID=2860290 RepID=A0ABQ6QDY9_9GAMM|nr:hypothetical protein STENOSP10_25540 [Stenotrophomonas sepilia]